MKKFNKILILTVVLLLLTTMLIGCSQNKDAGLSRQQISIGTAGTSGTFYIMGAGFADLINKELGINSVAEVTGGSVENIKLIGDKKIEMGVTQVDVALNALKGEKEFDEPIEVNAVVPMYPNVVQIVTLKDSDINSFSDLRGKRVSVGSPGSGILATNEIILETLGLSLDDIKPEYLSFSETTEAFRNGTIDAAIVNTAAPAPWIVDLETTHPVKLIPLTAEEIAKFTSEPYFVEAVIDKDAYNSIDEDIPTFAVWITLVADPDLPEDLVYDVCKTIMENQDYLKDVHVVSKYVILDNVKQIEGIPYHPGAIKYFEEQGIEFDN